MTSIQADAIETERRLAREAAKKARAEKLAKEKEEWRRLNPELAAAEDKALADEASGAPHPGGRCKVLFPSYSGHFPFEPCM